jgi:hypothetical protein
MYTNISVNVEVNLYIASNPLLETLIIGKYLVFIMQGGRNRGSSVSIGTGYELDGRGSILGRIKTFSVLCSIQTGSEPHSSLYPMVTGALSPGVKRSERESDQSLPSSVGTNNGGAVRPIPIRLHGVVLNELSIRTTLFLSLMHGGINVFLDEITAIKFFLENLFHRI